MRKSLMLCLMISMLGSFCPASVIARTSELSFGFNTGYSFGVSDAFKEKRSALFDDYGELVEEFKSKSHTSISFEGKARYGVHPHVDLALIFHSQAGETKRERLFVEDGVSATENAPWHWYGALFNGHYTFAPQATTTPYFTGGVGWYFPDDGISEPGLNIGGGVERVLRANVSLEIGMGFHVIFTDPEDNYYFNLHIGINAYPRNR